MVSPASAKLKTRQVSRSSNNKNVRQDEPWKTRWLSLAIIAVFRVNKLNTIQG